MEKEYKVVQLKDIKVGVVGLGYVGLPLAVEFGRFFSVCGYDTSVTRISELQRKFDRTNEISRQKLEEARFLNFTSKPDDLKTANIYVVTVPTPVTKSKSPDLTFLSSACELIGQYLSRGNIVIFESTVFPGCTEDFCVPILEKISGLKFKIDFECGYSPERINPGDKERKLSNIVKVVSASSEESKEVISEMYAAVIKAGIHVAPTIRVAEAAKIIENIQRDVNIALINELAMLFDLLGIKTCDVLEASGTKWNFLPFVPGLVGGHCIGVDPYYLTAKAEEVGFTPQMILSGRKTNEYMVQFVYDKIVGKLVRDKVDLRNLTIGILGLTFKENCSDTRNSKVIELCEKFITSDIDIKICDPVADEDELKNLYNFDMVNIDSLPECDVIVYCVPHEEFKKIGVNIANFLKPNGFIFDLKASLKDTELSCEILSL